MDVGRSVAGRSYFGPCSSVSGRPYAKQGQSRTGSVQNGGRPAHISPPGPGAGPCCPSERHCKRACRSAGGFASAAIRCTEGRGADRSSEGLQGIPRDRRRALALPTSAKHLFPPLSATGNTILQASPLSTRLPRSSRWARARLPLLRGGSRACRRSLERAAYASAVTCSVRLPVYVRSTCLRRHGATMRRSLALPACR